MLDLTRHLKIQFFLNFYKKAGTIIFVSFALQLLLGMTRGFGLLMVVPVLYLSGVLSEGPEEGALGQVASLLEETGVSLNLGSALILFVCGVSFFALLKRVNSLLETRIWQQYVRDLQKEVYRSLSFSNWGYLLKTKSSDVVHTLTHDLAMVSSGVRQGLASLGFVVIGAANISVAMMISWKMTLLTGLVGAFLWKFLSPLNRESRERGETQRNLQRNLFAEITQNLGAIKLIKSSGTEERSYDEFSDTVEQMHFNLLGFHRLRANGQLLFEVFAAVSLSLFIYISLSFDLLGPASLVMLIYLFVRLIPLVSSLQQSWQMVLNAVPSYDGYQSLINELKINEENPLEAGTPFSLDEGIRGASISFAYDSTRSMVLSNLEFEVPANKITILAGDSGRGKTTLLDIVIGLLPPSSGQIFVDGVELDDTSRRQWRRHVAYVPQETFLFHDTIRANLAWAKPNATDQEMLEALDLFAGGFVRELPEGLDARVGERGQQLSGGERQRIALARAFLSAPLLFVLDEATNALDRDSEAIVLNSLKKLTDRMTVLIVTHKAELLQKADLVIKL